ncbi:MAG: copper chaperone PCu(A)C [Anaerolineae bacterium]|nr:copper chaperone PCu(A)C [Anaerolineae bacterium]
MQFRTRLLSIIILLGIVLVSCQNKINGPNISIKGAWSRPSPNAAQTGAIYLVIKNNGSDPDLLLKASSSACSVIELHESYKTEEGIMGMRPVEGNLLEILAGEEVELKIGGLHFMCIDKLINFDPGISLPLTLEFKNSGKIELEVEIKEP